MEKQKKPPKRMARKRKTGAEGFFMAIAEAAAAGLRLYQQTKPIIKHMKGKKKNGNSRKGKV